MAAVRSSPAAPSETLHDARAVYLAEAGLPPDGGDSLRWVTGRLGPIPFAFPNTDARRRAVRYHDLHHVLTGYGTDGVGEAEIGAWEVASGCGGFVAAWVLDSYAAFYGLFAAPRATWRAFLRGRNSRNLYGESLDDSLLAETVPAVQARLGLDAALPEARAGDRLAFAVTVLAWVTLAIGPTALLVTAALAWLG